MPFQARDFIPGRVQRVNICRRVFDDVHAQNIDSGMRAALTLFACAAITANFEKDVAHEDGGRGQGVQKACRPHCWSHERVNGICRGWPEERANRELRLESASSSEGNRVGIALKFAAPGCIAAEYGILGGGWFSSGAVVLLGAEAGGLRPGESDTGGSTIINFPAGLDVALESEGGGLMSIE